METNFVKTLPFREEHEVVQKKYNNWEKAKKLKLSKNEKTKQLILQTSNKTKLSFNLIPINKPINENILNNSKNPIKARSLRN